MDFPVWTLIPFVLMLLGIAVFPLVPQLAHLWERPRNQLLYALVLGMPVAIGLLVAAHPELVAHALIEYVQFIVLLLALFTVSGGIVLRGDLAATPRTNTAFLAVGGLLASFIGTTGAAMLLIRPILATNAERRYRAHTVVFTIFVVANCGGLLTPLGDPPLFLGMLRGVPFTWTFSLLPMWLFVNALLLLSYWALDRRFHAREKPEALEMDTENRTPLSVAGASNLIWFAVIIFAVALIPSLDIDAVAHGQLEGVNWVPWRELTMLAAAACSFVIGSKAIRFEENEFTWAPIQEVGALFVGIFLTMVPALQVLRAAAPNLPLNEITLFVFTGGLSSVLDNAPTYVTFFEMATQIAGEPRVANVPEALLVSISLGAVLCGALTYIGNGPNFMVKSVAEDGGVSMPTFLGYVRAAFIYLAPVLLAMLLLFIAEPWWAKVLGGVTVALILVRALRHATARPPQVLGRGARRTEPEAPAQE
ncbi:Na+/H+ antiporter NhaD-like permease [Brachybacterium faecium DSM 4810]|uniref:Na+/H+ antiporter NhaD-like permease n=1 Tax=Brachybacterium faecium (strain ATCC 43885 / DSM 4810 / JCM 11609 / LMG 19847 / NBRC 14762 / NCIMB 9860 / 6-10) TaxID=446465 RepID=C7MAD3_BRAFD|nr:sodium:proton antiporter [Brachybacterium faecium]ACU86803.1 Na+/H+ antiporter NhaD-like permease [Brachybacterium faecium DSM 4810]